MVIKNGFLKSVIVLASGTAGAQAIALCVMPIVTRLYQPEALGDLSLFSTILSFLIIFVSLSFPTAIVIAKNDLEAKKLSSLAMVATVSLVLILIALIFLLHIFYNQHIINFIYKNLSWFIVGILGGVFFNIVRQYAVREQKFSKISKSLLYQAFFTNTLRLGLGIAYPFSLSLIFLHSVSNIFNAILLKSNNFKKFTSKEAFFLIKKYRDFPLYRMPQMLLNSATEGVPVLFLTQFYGMRVVGLYSLARLTLGAPTMLVGQSINDVFYPKFAKEKNKEVNRKLFIRTTAILSIIGSILFSVIFFGGDLIYSLVFGDKWEKAGSFASWIGVWMFAYLSSRPAISAIAVLNIQKQFLIFEIISLLMKVSGLFLGFYFYSDSLISIALFSLFSMLSYILLIFFVYKKI